MDNCLDHYLSSSSTMSDMNALGISSWEFEEPCESNEMLTNSLGQIGNDLSGRGAQIQKDGEIYGGRFSNGMLNGQVKGEDVADYGIALPRIGSYVPLQESRRIDFPRELPEICDQISLSITKMGYAGSDGTEPFEFHRSFGDLPTLSSVPEILPQLYDSVYSLSNIMEADRIQAFGLGGGSVDNEIDNRFAEMNKILQLDNMPASATTKEGQVLQNDVLPSFATRPQTAGKTVALPSLLETTSMPTHGGNGTGKPRVRARRGQATDPHSIAERLRREKIAERMRDLQELVPNSTKSDKASMLDEIIEYVKFLQLQVKVLSMSRLGAAGAVVPLIIDSHSEGSNGLSLSPSSLQLLEFSPSANEIAFEQEVVKLMESNVSTAMQYLQSRGLCLMPIALATAISKAKAPSTEKSGCLVQNSSSSSN